MAQSVPVHYHISDYERWEGDWELIDGIPVAMSPPPTIHHQLLATRILTELTNSLEACDLCLVVAEAEWRIADDTVLRPDGVIICYAPGKYLDRPPALALEVLSPSTLRIDREYKHERYAREGVPHYLIADPDEKRVEAYRLAGESYEKVGETASDTLVFNLGSCTAQLDVARVMARL